MSRGAIPFVNDSISDERNLSDDEEENKEAFKDFFIDIMELKRGMSFSDKKEMTVLSAQTSLGQLKVTRSIVRKESEAMKVLGVKK